MRAPRTATSSAVIEYSSRSAGAAAAAALATIPSFCLSFLGPLAHQGRTACLYLPPAASGVSDGEEDKVPPGVRYRAAGAEGRSGRGRSAGLSGYFIKLGSPSLPPFLRLSPLTMQQVRPSSFIELLFAQVRKGSPFVLRPCLLLPSFLPSISIQLRTAAVGERTDGPLRRRLWLSLPFLRVRVLSFRSTYHS